jgi:hypothetical protein
VQTSCERFQLQRDEDAEPMTELEKLPAALLRAAFSPAGNID